MPNRAVSGAQAIKMCTDMMGIISFIRRCKYAETHMTNSQGVFTQNLGPDVFDAEPIISVTPKASSGSYDWRYTILGDVSSGFTVTITFTQRNTSIVNLVGLLSLNLNAAIISPITFSLIGIEP